MTENSLKYIKYGGKNKGMKSRREATRKYNRHAVRYLKKQRAVGPETGKRILMIVKADGILK